MKKNVYAYKAVQLFACWVIFHDVFGRLLIFTKSTFSKNSFNRTIRVSNGLDPDQARHFVGPDQGPNCSQRLSADDKISSLQAKSKARCPLS